MDESRDPGFLPHDAPLRADVHRLGAMVGDMLAEQIDQAFLDEVETVRRAAIRRREAGEPPEILATRLRDLAPQHATALTRAFSAYFQMVNIAERVHRIRRRRDYQRAGAAPQPDGLHDVLLRLREAGVGLDELRTWLPRIAVEPVFTAHPTEAVRRSLLEKEQVMVRCLVADLDGQLTPGERAVQLAHLRICAPR